jgi:putative peptidoglycan lipid II flippase
MRFAINSVVVNIVASFVLSHYFSHVGIAMATSLAAWTNAAQLYFRLHKLGHFSFDARSKNRLPLIIVSTVIMAAVLFGLTYVLRENFAENTHFVHALWGLLALMLAGIGSYFVAAQVTGAFRVSELKAAFKR